MFMHDSDGESYDSAEILARPHTKVALGVLLEVMLDANVSPGVRVRAAEAVLSRGWGKPLMRVLEMPASPAERALQEGSIFETTTWREISAKIGLSQGDIE